MFQQKNLKKIILDTIVHSRKVLYKNGIRI